MIQTLDPDILFPNVKLLDDGYSANLPINETAQSTSTQLPEAGAYVQPVPAPVPELIAYSADCAELLGFDQEIHTPEFLALMAGNAQFQAARPFAMNYAGHQFGHWAGQLGDGRAIQLFEAQTAQGRRAVQLKGAGPTAFSRRGDGFAVLRSSIREFICSEAMHHLGVPTTRALSLIGRGEAIMRDILYDGRPAPEPSAVVARVAPSFIRFGHFELAARRGDLQLLKQLTLFSIRHYFPEVQQQFAAELAAGQISRPCVEAFFQTIQASTVELVAHWQTLGFTHGVLNTDNMSIHGITIDYGPYGWLEPYDPQWTPNTTDFQGRRYAFGQQPPIALWNLWQLGNALAPLVDDSSGLSASLSGFQQQFSQAYAAKLAQKLGVADVNDKFIKQLETLLTDNKIDMTIFFRGLTQVHDRHSFQHLLKKSSYLTRVADQHQFADAYLHKIAELQADPTDRLDAMDSVNPVYVPRNYLLFEAITQATQGDYAKIHVLQKVLREPFQDHGYDELAAKRPAWAEEQVGCSVLSCSS